MAEAELSWRVEKGPYLGDVSALCFLYHPWESSVPYLLAGTGSQLFLYDLETGKLLCSSHVFDGIRVHGIHSSCYLLQDFDLSYSMRTSAVTVAVFGERRVKLFAVQLRGKTDSNKKHLDLLQILPTFGHWVTDVRFLKGLDMVALEQNSGTEGKVYGSFLVIGLSDNSVHLWDIAQSRRVLEVKCTERCLLYSMSLWGDSIKTLCVASGTIYNEILIWKIVSQQAEVDEITSEVRLCTGTTIECTDKKLCNLHYGSILLNKLTGHEGSIFRIAWSDNGLKLLSASDDRSARIWICKFNGKDIHDSWAISHPRIVAGPILFGHSARIWDCYISDVIIITASEDCTCCIWQPNGEHVATIKGHIGRGVWRCAFDAGTGILITAGSDSSIKMLYLRKQIARHILHTNAEDNDGAGKMEVFKICLQGDLPTGSREFMDSKSEYVRCLKLAQESCLYVATNLGYLHCIDLTVPGEERWTTIVKINDREPIICLDLVILKSSDSTEFQEDWVAIGDAKGRVTVVQLISSNLKHEITKSFVWSAERQRQLLGIYWCKSLGHRHLFTTDPKGSIKLWRLKYASRERIESHEMVDGDLSEGAQAYLVAVFVSIFSARIVCIDASPEDELLVCGDQRGNLVVFKLPVRLLAFGLDDTIVQENFQTFCSFKGAHGISSVVSISVARSNGNQVHICSTGKDGCICSFIFDNTLGNSSNKLTFTGIKDVPDITMVEGVVNYINITGDGMQRRFAAGFTSKDFLLWDLTNESELLRVSCGGWRRPHSYFIGVMPEIQNCFAYLKDHTITVFRNWVPDDQIKLFPQSLHTQFHGREIHSVHFIPMPASLFYGQNDHPPPQISWIATGSEDGTVRITRYSSMKTDKLSLSLLLGEHVGGSAVRSITTVSKVYTLQVEGHTKQNDLTCGTENRETPLLLLSVGSKQVLTCWLLKWVKESEDKNELSDKLDHACTFDTEKYSSEATYMISFQWLSTYMQPRFHKPPKKLGSGDNQCHTNGTIPRITMPEVVMENESAQDEVGREKLKPIIDEETQDDWRYLAVTAFMVQAINPRSTVCFVVTACSNATLSMQALLLPDRLWFEVAVLDHERAPVLALQHIVIPLCHCSSDSIQNIYLVFSGATTGSIAVWDVTDIVNDFILQISSVSPGKDIVAQRRPRTGRGSQGGRRWRILRNQNGASEVTVGKVDAANIPISKPLSDATPIGVGEDTSLKTGVNSSFNRCAEELDNKLTRQTELEIVKESEKSSLKGLTGCSTNLDTSSDDIISMGRLHKEIPSIHPLHVFYCAHQSGVNCLHLSTLNGNGSLKTENLGSLYCVVSGGDDQALHIASFSLHVQQSENRIADNCIWNESKQPRKNSEFENHGLAEATVGNTASDGIYDKLTGHKAMKAVYGFTCLSREVIRSAHNSSIKGVWTDGHWVFSTGLDQRIRFWRFSFFDNICTVSEHFSSIINVPEPEALHTVASEKRNYYRIAVVGRGMQIVEFSNLTGNQDICEDAQSCRHK